MNQGRKNSTTTIAIIGSLILAIILVAGTVWIGRHARQDTEEAVRSVSLLYLDELAGRREQVVEDNLLERIQTIRVAIDLMTAEDLSDKAHLEAYQTRMKQLYHLDKFAFVDTEGMMCWRRRFRPAWTAFFPSRSSPHQSWRNSDPRCRENVFRRKNSRPGQI